MMLNRQTVFQPYWLCWKIWSMKTSCRSVLNSIRKILALPLTDKWLHFVAFNYLAAASAALTLLPENKVISTRSDMDAPAGVPREDQIDRAIHVGDVVARTASHCFWHPTCLPQALAAMWILRRVNIPIYLQLGVKNTGPAIEAHAWVEIYEQVIIGGQTRHEYMALNPTGELHQKMSGTS